MYGSTSAGIHPNGRRIVFIVSKIYPQPLGWGFLCGMDKSIPYKDFRRECIYAFRFCADLEKSLYFAYVCGILMMPNKSE